MSLIKASWAEPPHISSDGRSLLHTSGRSGLPISLQRLSVVRCRQRTPEGFPWGIPGRAEEMDGAMQHAPHPIRQSILLQFLHIMLFFSQLKVLIANRLSNGLPVRLSTRLHHSPEMLSAALHLRAGQCGPLEIEVVVPVLFPVSSNRYQ